MTIKEILAEKDFRMDDIPGGMVKSAEKASKEAVKELTRLLNQLELEDGKIALTEKNLALIEKIAIKIQDSVFESGYLDAIKDFASGIKEQAGLTNDYFVKVFGDEFQQEEIYKKLIQETQRKAVEALASDAVQAQFITPLKQQLSAAITTGSTFAETVKQLTNFIEGNKEVEGRLIRYVKQVAYDGFAVADRSYTHAVADRIGAEWYRYTGGTIKDSRPFCVERNGKYFHKKEIEKWASLEWAGKNNSSDKATIFAFAGGWNCRHSIMPVSENSVPKEVLERNKANVKA